MTLTPRIMSILMFLLKFQTFSLSASNVSSKLQALEKKIMMVNQFSGTVSPGEYKVSCRFGILPWTSLMGRFAAHICNKRQVVYIPFPEVSTISLWKVNAIPHQYRNRNKVHPDRYNPEVFIIIESTWILYPHMSHPAGKAAQSQWSTANLTYGTSAKLGKGREDGKEILWLSKCWDYLL